MEHPKNIKEEIIKVIDKLFKYDGKTYEEDLEIAGNFLILWNLFEKEFCDTNADKPKLKNIANEYYTHFDTNILHEVFEGIKKRYQDENKFENLRFRNENIKNEVRNTLDKSNNATDEEKLRAILYIIYRYRNNLFHGNKKLQLCEQKENFERSYKVLIELLKLKTSYK